MTHSPVPRVTGGRHGVALLTALMSLVLIAALAAAARASTGAGAPAVELDIVSVKARWQVEGCAAVGVAVLNQLQATHESRAWHSLDSAFAQTRVPTVVRGCDLRLFALGRVRSVQRADRAAVVRLLSAAGIAAARAESLSAALLDWTDADDVTRELGAESDWYSAKHRPTPRNGAVRGVDELRQVRGFDAPGFLDDTIRNLLGTVPARISIRHTSFAVLRSFEGMTDAGVAAIFRTRTAPPPALQMGPKTGSAEHSVPEAMTDEPDGWELRARILDADGRTTSERWLTLGRTQTRIGILSVRESR